MTNNEFKNEVSFDIVEEIGVIKKHPTGWSKELNMVSWNGGTPKYDIRDWNPDHSHMSKGVTLHEREMRTMLDLLQNRSHDAQPDERETEKTDTVDATDAVDAGAGDAGEAEQCSAAG